MKHYIITYCNESYKPCLDKFIHTWKKESDVVVYTDSPNFGEQIFDEPVESWKDNVTRKILTIEYALHNLKAKHITYLDADCMVRGDFTEVYKNPGDVIISRMVRRKDRPHGEQEINAGVIFLKNNKNTKQLVEEWFDLAEKYYPTDRYHEQTALSHLCLDAFDGLKPYTCNVVSERIYNCEHDEVPEFRKIIDKYNPKILHFKNGWWKDDKLVQDYIV